MATLKGLSRGATLCKNYISYRYLRETMVWLRKVRWCRLPKGWSKQRSLDTRDVDLRNFQLYLDLVHDDREKLGAGLDRKGKRLKKISIDANLSPKVHPFYSSNKQQAPRWQGFYPIFPQIGPNAKTQSIYSSIVEDSNRRRGLCAIRWMWWLVCEIQFGRYFREELTDGKSLVKLIQDEVKLPIL